ncbi:MAG: hypothetical protein Q9188_006681 [Gyalolechia gomerana]
MQSPKDRSPIQPLPQEVAAQLKSSRTISSLEHVTIGLVQNSMDAGATRIDVSVDFARGACTVEDDGWGISPEEFLDDGGLGKAYLEAQFKKQCAWRRRYLPGIFSGYGDIDNNFASLRQSLRGNLDLPPYKVCSKTSASTAPLSALAPSAWNQG